MIRLGLIGAGSWGQRYTARIACRSDCRIAAVARASNVPLEGMVDVERCSDWRSLVGLARSGALDGVIAATTPEHQAEVAAMCAETGVPLLVEKPIGLSENEARAVYRAALDRGGGAPILVDYIHLWAPAFVGLKRWIEEAGGPSRIAAISSAGCNRGPFRSWTSLYDYGAHDVAMVLTLLGADSPLTGVERKSLESADPRGVLFDVRMRFGAVPVRMRLGNGSATKARSFAVTLRDGREVIYDDMRQHPSKLMADGAPIAVREVGPLDEVLSDFLQRIQDWIGHRTPTASNDTYLALSTHVNHILDQLR